MLLGALLTKGEPSLLSPFSRRKHCKQSVPQGCSVWCEIRESLWAGKGPKIYCKAGIMQIKPINSYDCQVVWKDVTIRGCTMSLINLHVSLFSWVRWKTKCSLVKGTSAAEFLSSANTWILKLTQRRCIEVLQKLSEYGFSKGWWTWHRAVLHQNPKLAVSKPAQVPEVSSA